ncbi:hypothetical protein BRADI_4g16682v3, partial [Brachypodium distachyon]
EAAFGGGEAGSGGAASPAAREGGGVASGGVASPAAPEGGDATIEGEEEQLLKAATTTTTSSSSKRPRGQGASSHGHGRQGKIYKYVSIDPGSPDAPIMHALALSFASGHVQGGDPCLPSPWSWVQCTASKPQPRVVSIDLSGKNLTGSIPPELAALPCLVQIRLDNNMLTGPIPDLSAASNL